MRLRFTKLWLACSLVFGAGCSRAPQPRAEIVQQPSDGLDYMARHVNAGREQALYDLAGAGFRHEVSADVWDEQWLRIRRMSGDWVRSIALEQHCSAEGMSSNCEFQGVILFDHEEYRMDASWMVEADLPVLTQLHLQSNDPRIWIAAPLLVPVKTDPASWYYPPHRPDAMPWPLRPWRQTPIEPPAPNFLRDRHTEPADRS